MDDPLEERRKLEHDLHEVRQLSTNLEANPYSRDAYVKILTKLKSMGPFMAEELQNARVTMAAKVLLTESMFHSLFIIIIFFSSYLCS